MEDLQQIVTPLKRTQELAANMQQDRPGPWREYIANLVEMAYVAGANGLDVRGNHKHTTDLQTTGEVLVKARNYVKDKGLRI